MEKTPGASNSLCDGAKNRQISVPSEWYANRLWTVLRRFAVPSTHTRIWFTNRSGAVHEPFGTLVYTRLKASIILVIHPKTEGIQGVLGLSAFPLVAHTTRCAASIHAMLPSFLMEEAKIRLHNIFLE